MKNNRLYTKKPTESASNATDAWPASLRVEDVAAIAGLSTQYVRDLAHRGFLPPIKLSRMPGRDTVEALLKYYRRDGEALQRERLAKTTADRRLREIELGVAEGRYFNKEEAARDADALGVAINSVITSRLHNRMRVELIEATRQHPFEQPLSDGQFEAVLGLVCGFGSATADALRNELRTTLAKYQSEKSTE